jgi:hypothetical protein
MLQNWPKPELQEGFGFPAGWGTSSFLVWRKRFPGWEFARKMDWISWIKGVAPSIARPDTLINIFPLGVHQGLSLCATNSCHVKQIQNQNLTCCSISVPKCCKMCGWNYKNNLMCTVTNGEHSEHVYVAKKLWQF